MIFEKPVMGGVEDIEVNTTEIKFRSPEFAALFTDGAIRDYDSATGLGIIKVDKARFAFLEDVETGIIVPFYWSGNNRENPKMIVGVKKTANGYDLKFTRSKSIDATLKTNNFSIDIEKEFSAHIAPQAKFNALYSYASPNAEKYIKGLIDLGNGNGTIVVAPHATLKGNDALYYSREDVDRIRNALVEESDFESVVGDRNRIGINTFSQNGQKLEILMGNRGRLVKTTFNGDLEDEINKISKNLGTKKSKTKLKKGNLKSHKIVKAVAVGLVVAVGLTAGHFIGASLHNSNQRTETLQQTVDNTQQGEAEATLKLNDGIIETERLKTLNNLADETENAKLYGIEQANLNADGMTLVGNQYLDGKFDTKNVEALYDANFTDFVSYTQQNGLTYSAQIYVDENGDGYADKDENGNYLMVMQDFSLTQKEVEDAGKTYSYDEATKEGLWSQTAKLVVNAALEAGMPVATLNTDGTYRMNYFYQGDSRKAMVGAIGENATEEFEKSWENALEIALESGLAGSDAITNPKDVLKNEDVVYSASLIAGAGAEVLSVSDGMIYIKSADNNNLYTVPSTNGDSYEVSDLLNSMDTAIKNKTVEEYAQASDIFQAVLESGRDLSDSAVETLNAKYGDMYISHNLSNVNGSRTYYSTILTVDAEGNVKQSYGKEVYKNGAMNTSIAAVLSVDDTIALTGVQKQGYSTGAVHQEEVATEAEIAKSDEKSRG